jgi:hypothetical protein
VRLVVDEGELTEGEFEVKLPLCVKCYAPCTDKAYPEHVLVRRVVEDAIGQRWDGEMRAVVGATLRLTGLTTEDIDEALPPWRDVKVRWPNG